MRKIGFPENRLLAALPRNEYLRLLPNLEQVSLRMNQILYDSGQPMRYAFFPEQGLISLLADPKSCIGFEIATIGNEGFLGVPLALGGRVSTQLAQVQVAGSAMRMDARIFRATIRNGPFQKIVLHYIRYHLSQVSQFAIRNYLYRLQTRFAQLLLTHYDQVGSGEVLMTHQFISRVLGTAFSEVKNTAALFRRKGLIDYERGKIKVLDRKRLEAIASGYSQTIQRKLSLRNDSSPSIH